MKINFNQPLLALDGSVLLLDGDARLTLARVCSVSLLNDDTGDGNAKDKRFQWALRLHKGGEQDLSTEDVAWLKEIVGRVVHSTLHAGQARLMLEGQIDQLPSAKP